MKKRYIINSLSVVLALFTFLYSCTSQDETPENKEGEVVSPKVSGYSLTPVNIQNVRLSDNFWLPIIKRVQEKTIEYALKKCEEEGRFENFLVAGGKKEGTVKGAMPFDDTDVYKIIEGASNSLISSPNEELEILLDSLVGIIKTGQEQDGYLTTWRTIDPAKPPAPWVKVDEGKRWESLFMSHELYNAGHLYEAAYVHYLATGKRNFLDIALKNADLMVNTFGDEEGKIHAVPGHQIIETGLIKLYQITKKEEYLNLAKYFLDNRGNANHHDLFGPYSQDHVPVIQQDEVVGHSVRAVYMYAAMTDIAAIQKDSAYLHAVNNLWENMVYKKMYITGGIGAHHEGEAFGDNYELPNLTAYNETCASIGNVYWNHRLHNLTGEANYFDIIERTLYNGLISGLSLDGQKFFYPNALESDGVYKFNKGECTRQSWFDCSCCPTNLIRFIPSLPGLVYSTSEDTVYVNLYVSNTATIPLKDRNVEIIQTTEYPWNGTVNFQINPEKRGFFSIKLRIPGWAHNEAMPGDLYSYLENTPTSVQLRFNNSKIEADVVDGYIEITTAWKEGDKLSIDFPMEVKKVITNEKVTENQGKVALEYGPVVYAFEEVDNPEDFDSFSINSNDVFNVNKEDDLLGGVNVINNGSVKAIPYYAWSNRGIGKMKVWVKLNQLN